MRQADLKGRVLTLKIRLEGFETFTRQRKLPEFTNDAENDAATGFGNFSQIRPARRRCGSSASACRI
jgi:hypothetical protein